MCSIRLGFALRKKRVYLTVVVKVYVLAEDVLELEDQLWGP